MKWVPLCLQSEDKQGKTLQHCMTSPPDQSTPPDLHWSSMFRSVITTFRTIISPSIIMWITVLKRNQTNIRGQVINRPVCDQITDKTVHTFTGKKHLIWAEPRWTKSDVLNSLGNNLNIYIHFLSLTNFYLWHPHVHRSQAQVSAGGVVICQLL